METRLSSFEGMDFLISAAENDIWGNLPESLTNLRGIVIF
jgi:hypothetical protein